MCADYFEYPKKLAQLNTFSRKGKNGHIKTCIYIYIYIYLYTYKYIY